TGVFNAHGLQMKSIDNAAVECRVRRVRRHAIHVSGQSHRSAVIVHVPEVRVERTVLLRHEDDVVDRAHIARGSIVWTWSARNRNGTSRASAGHWRASAVSAGVIGISTAT